MAPTQNTLPQTSSPSTPPYGHPTSSETNRIFPKANFSWRVLGAVFAAMLVVGWVFIIVILIQEEKWQLVLVAWLLLYAAAHFCYWYFKRHHLLSIHSQICGRSRNKVAVTTPSGKVDAPPSYEDIIKSEAPPPAYYSVVIDNPKSNKLTSKYPLFSMQGLPRVFGRSQPSSPSSSTASSSSNSPSISSAAKRAESGKSFSSQNILTSSISASVDEHPRSWKSLGEVTPPPYTNRLLDNESQVITAYMSTLHPHSDSPPRRSVAATGPKCQNNVGSEFHPVYSNHIGSVPEISKILCQGLPRASSSLPVLITSERRCSTPN